MPFFFSDFKIYAHQMVRTDPKEQKLDAFLAPAMMIKQQSINGDEKESNSGEEGMKSLGHKAEKLAESGTRKRQLTPTYVSPAQRRRKHHRTVHLTSVKNLIQKLYSQQHNGKRIHSFYIFVQVC